MEELIEMHFSLAVCYKHIKRANKSIAYEENAIIEYSQVIKLIRKLFSNKYHEKIAHKLDRDYYIRKCTRAYNGIFDMLYETKQYKRAIRKCDELICDIESGMLENKTDKTLPMNKELSPIYCRISKMELLDLQLMKDYENIKNDPKNTIVPYKEEAIKALEEACQHSRLGLRKRKRWSPLPLRKHRPEPSADLRGHPSQMRAWLPEPRTPLKPGR